MSSPRELVIGADGFIGQRLQQLTGAEGTSRRNPMMLPNSYYLDLLAFEDKDLPEADLVYICAGVNGAHACEGNREAYRVNVDATAFIARTYVERGSFPVWISSSTVEWSNSSYARQKTTSESILLLLKCGVVRAGRVLSGNLDDLCNTLMRVGRGRISGLTKWGEELPYKK